VRSVIFGRVAGGISSQDGVRAVVGCTAPTDRPVDRVGLEWQITDVRYWGSEASPAASLACEGGRGWGTSRVWRTSDRNADGHACGRRCSPAEFRSRGVPAPGIVLDAVVRSLDKGDQAAVVSCGGN
jgi:hypothetical protein